MSLLQRESEEQIRSFVALPVPGNVKECLAGVQGCLSTELPRAKWVKSGGLHITMKFLGEIPKSRVERVTDALNDAISGKSFSMSFGELGVFPNTGKARVLWIGIEDGRDSCLELWKTTESAMESVGFQKEKRPFRAHLTLARFRDPVSLTDGVPHAGAAIPAFTVNRVVLYRSVLKPTGAEYSELASFPLE